jgi:hypothetical protein
MAEAFRKYSTAKAKAQGQTVVRVADVYLTGVTALDEITLLSPAPGSGSAHITMRHLDRLGNGNYAIAVAPHNRLPAYGDEDATNKSRVGLAMGIPEAMSLWELLDRVLAGNPVTDDLSLEKLRWTRDRLARVTKGILDKESGVLRPVTNTYCNPPESKFCGREDCPTCQGRFWERK